MDLKRACNKSPCASVSTTALLENYDLQPVQLTNVKRERVSQSVSKEGRPDKSGSQLGRAFRSYGIARIGRFDRATRRVPPITEQ